MLKEEAGKKVSQDKKERASTLFSAAFKGKGGGCQFPAAGEKMKIDGRNPFLGGRGRRKEISSFRGNHSTGAATPCSLESTRERARRGRSGSIQHSKLKDELPSPICI